MQIHVAKLELEAQNNYKKLLYDLGVASQSPTIGIDLDVWSGRVEATRQMVKEIQKTWDSNKEVESEKISQKVSDAASAHYRIAEDISRTKGERKRSMGMAGEFISYLGMLSSIEQEQRKRLTDSRIV